MGRVTMAELPLDEMEDMNAAELIRWINGYVADADCAPELVEFEFQQYGDHWDGYSLAYINVTRPMTAEDRIAQEEERRLMEERRERETREREMAILASLQRKYGATA